MGAILGGLILLFLVCCGIFPFIEFSIGIIIIIILGAVFLLAGIYVAIDGDVGIGILSIIIGLIVIFVGIAFL